MTGLRRRLIQRWPRPRHDLAQRGVPRAGGICATTDVPMSYAKGRRTRGIRARSLQGACVIGNGVVYFARRSRGSRAASIPFSRISRSLWTLVQVCERGVHTHAVMTQVGGLQGLSLGLGFWDDTPSVLSTAVSPTSDTVPRSRAGDFGPDVSVITCATCAGDHVAIREEEVLDFGHRSDTALP